MDVMFLVYVVMALAMFFFGFIAGVLTKGININITKKEPEPVIVENPVYNTSTEDSLPDEVRDYYEKTKGFMNV